MGFQFVMKADSHWRTGVCGSQLSGSLASRPWPLLSTSDPCRQGELNGAVRFNCGPRWSKSITDVWKVALLVRVSRRRASPSGAPSQRQRNSADKEWSPVRTHVYLTPAVARRGLPTPTTTKREHRLDSPRLEHRRSSPDRASLPLYRRRRRVHHIVGFPGPAIAANGGSFRKGTCCLPE